MSPRSELEKLNYLHVIVIGETQERQHQPDSQQRKSGPRPHGMAARIGRMIGTVPPCNE